VLDFNVHASRGPTVGEKLAAARMGIDAARPPEGSRFVCEPSAFAADTVFANEVVTALPYYSMPAPGQCESYVGYMIDEQRLLGLKVRFVRWRPHTFLVAQLPLFFFLFWEIKTIIGKSVY
jgi:hypothetical protein